jgi:hypothetical protein
MINLSKLMVPLVCVSLIGGMGVVNPGNVYASNDRDYERREHRDDKKYKHPYPSHKKPYVIRRGPVIVVPEKRVRRYHDIYIYRPYGHWYPGYGHYHLDSDAFMWLAFTAITLKILDNLNEEQQRAHEAAQIRATTAPIGETIIWNEGGASGSVTPTRDGTSTSGRYCREFQHEVTIGGKKEQAYGVACQQPDGSWEIVSTGTP